MHLLHYQMHKGFAGSLFTDYTKYTLAELFRLAVITYQIYIELTFFFV